MDKKISYISSEFGICQNEFPKGIQNLHSSIYLRVFTIVICSDTCKQKQPKVPPLTSASSHVGLLSTTAHFGGQRDKQTLILCDPEW